MKASFSIASILSTIFIVAFACKTQVQHDDASSVAQIEDTQQSAISYLQAPTAPQKTYADLATQIQKAAQNYLDTGPSDAKAIALAEHILQMPFDSLVALLQNHEAIDSLSASVIEARHHIFEDRDDEKRVDTHTQTESELEKHVEIDIEAMAEASAHSVEAEIEQHSPSINGFNPKQLAPSLAISGGVIIGALGIAELANLAHESKRSAQQDLLKKLLIRHRQLVSDIYLMEEKRYEWTSSKGDGKLKQNTQIPVDTDYQNFLRRNNYDPTSDSLQTVLDVQHAKIEALQCIFDGLPIPSSSDLKLSSSGDIAKYEQFLQSEALKVGQSIQILPSKETPQIPTQKTTPPVAHSAKAEVESIEEHESHILKIAGLLASISLVTAKGAAEQIDLSAGTVQLSPEALWMQKNATFEVNLEILGARDPIQ